MMMDKALKWGVQLKINEKEHHDVINLKDVVN